VSDTLYYEVLDIPLREFESKKSLKVSWHNLQAEETVRLRAACSHRAAERPACARSR
jgi:hypothetical protein